MRIFVKVVRHDEEGGLHSAPTTAVPLERRFSQVERRQFVEHLEHLLNKARGAELPHYAMFEGTRNKKVDEIQTCRPSRGATQALYKSTMLTLGTQQTVGRLPREPGQPRARKKKNHSARGPNKPTICYKMAKQSGLIGPIAK